MEATVTEDIEFWHGLMLSGASKVDAMRKIGHQVIRSSVLIASDSRHERPLDL